MKKHRILPLVITLLAIVISLVIVFFFVRRQNYNLGKENGYLAGYSIGYIDCLHGEVHHSQTLAGEIAPYDYGTSRWKGFMMGFPTGYKDGAEKAQK